MDIRNDEAWRAAAERLARAMDAKAEAEAEYQAALDAITLLAPDGGKGCGISVTQVLRKGAIAYAKALEALLPGLTPEKLEPYRGKDSFGYRVTRA